MLNTPDRYGVIAKLLHWASALMVFGLFGLGIWMVELGYYDSWYQKAPHIHRSVGIILIACMLLRLLVLIFSGKPAPLSTHSRREILAAHVTHYVIYALILLAGVTGYLISTADGRGIEVFNWFVLPSMGAFFPDQESLAGQIHTYLAYSLVVLAVIHGLAALKHHFIDKDSTLKRML
jgi:cytochrome b561